MANDASHEIPLRYGKTDGTNLPFMPNDKYFVIGYNQRFGLVDVMESNGDPFFEGRVNIESLLSSIQSNDQEVVNSHVEDYIMEAYNTMEPQESDSSSTPILEILSYNK